MPLQVESWQYEHYSSLSSVLRDTGMRTGNYLRIQEHMQSFCIRTQFLVLRHLSDPLTAWIEGHYNYPGVLRDPGFFVYVLLANFFLRCFMYSISSRL